MIKSSSNKDSTSRTLEQQLQESRRREEDLQRRAGELQTQVDDSNRRAGELQTQVDDANRRAGELQRQVQSSKDRVQDLQRSLVEMTQELRQHEDHLQGNCTHWVVTREEIELTGPEVGVGSWATVTVVKFRVTRVAVKELMRR